MDIQKWIWFSVKALSFVSLGAIVYVLFCMKGLWVASIATRMVTRVIPLLVAYYVFDTLSKKIKPQ